MPDLTPWMDETVALTWKRYVQQFMVDEGLLLDVDVAMQRELFGSVAYQFRYAVPSTPQEWP